MISIAGAPTRPLWISLCVFTVVGTLLYLLETVNTFSAAYGSSGDTAISIHLELLVTLLFEHIPLATIDYFVARYEMQKFHANCKVIDIYINLYMYIQVQQAVR